MYYMYSMFCMYSVCEYYAICRVLYTYIHSTHVSMWTTYVVFEQHTIWVGPFALCDLCSSSTDVNSLPEISMYGRHFPGTELNGLVVEQDAVWSDGRHFVGENGDKLILVIRGEVEQFRRTFKSTGK